jgi:hypothetical protein
MSLMVVTLASPTKLHAFGGPPGGPFGNGSFFPTQGTFQATLRAINLSGVATFNSTGGGGQTQLQTTAQITDGNSTASLQEQQASAGGYFSIFYSGTTYTGNVDGGIDPAAGSISVLLEGSNPGGGNQTTNTVSSNYTVVGSENVDGGTAIIPLPDQEVENIQYDGNGTIISRSITRFSGRTEEILLPDTVEDAYGWVDTITTYSYKDSFYTAGYFDAKLQNSFPNQIFKGKGMMTFTSVDTTQKKPVLKTETVPISVRGVRLSSVSSSYTAQPVSKPTVVESVTVENRGSGIRPLAN